MVPDAGVSVRFHLPPKAIRVEVVALLRDYYAERDAADFARAWKLLATFYAIPTPRVKWRRSIEGGHTLGLTHDENIVELIDPPWFARRSPPDNTEDVWVAVALHEWHHALHWVQTERKADQYAAAMMEE